MLTTETAAGQIEAGVVYDLDYWCDTPGPEIDEGSERGFWTGEIDWCGKLTFAPLDGSPHLYFFPREIIELEKVNGALTVPVG